MRWEVDCPPSQHIGQGSNLFGGLQPAYLPSFGRYSLDTLNRMSMNFKSSLPNLKL